VVSQALLTAGVKLEDLDGFSVTCQPGLSGALLVGIQFAQGLAWATQKPIVGVDHLVGHLLAVYLKYPDLAPPAVPEFPFIALLVSGGHTALYLVAGTQLNQITELGATRDDAAGEAYDKTAKLLGLGYPGGPIIDRLAALGDPDVIALSRPMKDKSSLEFSFSGLKTQVARWVETNGRPEDAPTLHNLCAAFQRRVVDTLIQKSITAARQHGLKTIVIGGGVAANRELRARSQLLASKHGIQVIVPPFRCCTDNAAMIAYAGTRRLLLGENDAFRLNMSPRSALPRLTRKGRGLRVEAAAR
jgi:N6-L-threonylcarbamoyladenine synthase